MYPDSVTCEDQPAHRTVLSAPLFLEQNIKFCRASSGPTLSAKLVCHSLFGGGGGLLGPTLGPTQLIVSAADKGTGQWFTDMFEIKEADYQTTCCCCFKNRVARGEPLGARKRT